MTIEDSVRNQADDSVTRITSLKKFARNGSGQNAATKAFSIEDLVVDDILGVEEGAILTRA
jgi:hypothetical protein